MAIKMNIINSNETKTVDDAKAAAIDVACRSAEAIQDNPAFVANEHVNRVEAVKNIARTFFTVRENIYINHRANKRRPFTAVKIYRTQWPVVSPKTADKNFYKPLDALGNVELLRDRNGTSHIIRVYL